jgi:hypothetical protein
VQARHLQLQLPIHQIQPRHHLRDAMLHLRAQPRTASGGG